MKYLSLFVAVLLGLLVFMGFSEMLPAQTTKEKTVEEKIIDILKDEKIIGAEKYNALKKQLENEKITDTNKTRLTFKKGFG
ncbi:MAG: hypothetical protein SVW57_08050, partial [Thermodesulfobacteriota bacterium]|nr:hypothetical protein [Thermodesulfobacteriota bacterium]